MSDFLNESKILLLKGSTNNNRYLTANLMT